LPKTRPDFWRAKIQSNQTRDESALEKLAQLEWRVLVVWECSLRGVGEHTREAYFDELSCSIRKT
jgi:DNA mismatch endonuclease (patch repair protein)